MIVEDNPTDLKSFFNLEAFQNFISLYKFPLILAVVGIIFLLLGFVYIVKTQNSSAEVVFSTDSTASANISEKKIQVDLEGAVMVPGVYQMREGERVSDALVAAGGLSADADREWVEKNLNRAAKLVDGGKIYIPSVTETTSGIITNAQRAPELQITNVSGNSGQLLGVTAGKVNINAASQTELEWLPGVGPVTAGKIISSRPYQSVEELKGRKIIGNALYEKIKDLLSI